MATGTKIQKTLDAVKTILLVEGPMPREDLLNILRPHMTSDTQLPIAINYGISVHQLEENEDGNIALKGVKGGMFQ